MHNYSEEPFKIDYEISIHPILTNKMKQTRGQVLNRREGERIAKLLRNFNIQHLEKDIEEIIERIITKYLEVFTLGDESLPCTNLTEYDITLKSGKIVNLKSHRLPEKHRKFSLTETSYRRYFRPTRKNIKSIHSPHPKGTLSTTGCPLD